MITKKRNTVHAVRVSKPAEDLPPANRKRVPANTHLTPIVAMRKRGVSPASTGKPVGRATRNMVECVPESAAAAPPATGVLSPKGLQPAAAAALTPQQAAVTCVILAETLTQRRAALNAINSLRNQQWALVRRAFGWSLSMSARERAIVAREAKEKVTELSGEMKRVRTEITKASKIGRPPTLTMPQYSDYRGTVLCLEAAILPLLENRAVHEKTMERLAKSLPLNDFVESIKGFGYFGLAVILAEAGDLGIYDNPAKLWKRMGLAVIFGKSQRLSKEDWKVQGYSSLRRSAMYTIGDSLLKKQNDYKKLYDERKVYLQSPAHKAVASVQIESKLHIHKQAQRYVEKRLLKDLWKTWRRAFGLSNHDVVTSTPARTAFARGQSPHATQGAHAPGTTHDDGQKRPVTLSRHAVVAPQRRTRRKAVAA